MCNFKKGDRVIVKQRPNITLPKKEIVGKVGTVLENGANPFVEFDENIGGHNGTDYARGKCGHVWAICDEDLELVKEEKSEGEKEMKVICVNPGSNLMINKGQIYDVVERDDTWTTVIREDGQSCEYLSIRFEEVKEEVEEKEDMFKVGDLVQIVDTGIFASFVKEGEIAKVTEIIDGENCIKIDREGWNYNQLVLGKAKDCIKKIEATEQEVEPLKIRVAFDETVEVGDIVQISGKDLTVQTISKGMIGVCLDGIVAFVEPLRCAKVSILEKRFKALEIHYKGDEGHEEEEGRIELNQDDYKCFKERVLDDENGNIVWMNLDKTFNIDEVVELRNWLDDVIELCEDIELSEN